MYDIIIKAGRQGDGKLVDIAIQQGKIAAIGTLPETAAAQQILISAAGCM